MSFIFHSVNIVYHNTDLCMLTHVWIPEINLIWSQCMVPFLCCWIWFANVLLKKIDIYIHQRYWSEFSTISAFDCMGKYHSFISEGHHFHIKYFRIIGFFSFGTFNIPTKSVLVFKVSAEKFNNIPMGSSLVWSELFFSLLLVWYFSPFALCS